MPRIRTLQRAFTGGVISPALWGHVEDTKIQTGAAVMENMVPWTQGKLTMRPGTALVRETGDSTKTSVLRSFNAGSTAAYTVGIETGYFRFYIGGEVILWATSHLVESISTGANSVTFTEPHGFIADQDIRLVVPALSVVPVGVGITTAAPMFVKAVVDEFTITLSATMGGAVIDITDAGSGDLWFYDEAEMPRDYVESQNLVAVDTTDNTLEYTAHDFTNGDPIEFTAAVIFTADASDVCTAIDHGFNDGVAVTVASDTTLPGGLSAGTVYYVNVLDADTFQLLATADAIAAVNITDAGTGVHTATVEAGEVILTSTPDIQVGGVYYARIFDANNITVHATAAAAIAGTGAFDFTVGTFPDTTARVHYHYTQGALVNLPDSGIYYAEIDSPNDSLPGGVDWYLLPFTGEYEIPNPYVETNLLHIDRDQIADTMTLGHPDHGLYDLARFSDLLWTFNPSTFSPVLDPPETITGVGTLGQNLLCSFTNASPAVFTTTQLHGFIAGITTVYLDILSGTISAGDGLYVVATTGGAGLTFTLMHVNSGATLDSSSTGTAKVQQSPLSANITNTYAVTAIRVDGAESLVSDTVSVTNNLFVDGAYNTITWSAVTGAERYRIYKSENGLFGYLGDSYELTFRDDNIAPDLSVTPPLFDTSLTHPGVLASFEQRRVLADNEGDLSQTLWFTELGTTNSLVYHLPVIDTDRIKFDLASPFTAAVRFVAPMANLIILTESTEFVMTTVDSDALTPTSFRARPVSYVGSSSVKPLMVNDKLIFFGNRTGRVYEFSLRAAFEGYRPVDLCLRAPHLFDGYTIVDATLQKAPLTIVWCVRSDGALLGLTYSPEEEVVGWHLHTTNGEFERVCASAEGGEDRLYVIVKRTIDGETKRFVERFAPFLPTTTIGDAFHVDCGISFEADDPEASSVTGYGHLEGEEVVANADGVSNLGLEVTDGVIPAYAFLNGLPAIAHIGLGYEGVFQSLPVSANADGAAVQGRVKGTNTAYARVIDSGQFKLGVTDNDLEMVPGGTASGLTTGEARIVLPGTWSEGGQVFIKQPNPLPLQIVSLVSDVELGGA